MNRRLVCFIAASLLAGSVVASDKVANLSEMEGTVLVSQGEKFVTAEAGQVLGAGDRVLVMEGGKATVTFTDGCALPVEPGTHIVLPEKSTCAGGIAQTQQISPQVAQAVGGGAASNTAFFIVVGITGALIVNEVSQGEDNVSSP